MRPSNALVNGHGPGTNRRQPTQQADGVEWSAVRDPLRASLVSGMQTRKQGARHIVGVARDIAWSKGA
jgi:hypothetical protein